MNANTFGHRFQMHSFGESHGTALGVVIEGCPAGLEWNQELLLRELARRRPGAQSIQVQSQRQEEDAPEILSGVFEGKTLGTPIAMMVRNRDAKSEDYKAILEKPRTGHADDVWREKFGHGDHRGGGRSSGRETLSRVMAGAVAQMLLRKLSPETRVVSFASQIGQFELSNQEIQNFLKSKTNPDQFVGRFPSEKHTQVGEMLKIAQTEGQSYGGKIKLVIEAAPKGLGQPVFHKLKSDLAAAMISIGAVSGFEIGSGFDSTGEKGTEFHSQNNYGGIRGGISTGEPIEITLAVKPTSSILDVAKKGRHDPCIIPRMIPVVDAMASLVLADHLLWARQDKI